MQNLGSVTNPKDIPTKEYVDNSIAAVILPLSVVNGKICITYEEGST